jgi:hypothetical protein
VKRLMWQDIFVKFLILFIISSVLVLGFWFHSMFYQYGLIPLLAVGGLVTLIIIFVTSRTLSFKPLFRVRAKGSVEFTEKEKSMVLKGEKRVHVVPLPASRLLRVNTHCTAVCEGERFAAIYITDVRRALVQDIAEGELAPVGFSGQPDISEFGERPDKKPGHAAGIATGKGADTIVNVLSFEVDNILPGAE